MNRLELIVARGWVAVEDEPLLLAVAGVAAWPNWSAWADAMELRGFGIPVLFDRLRKLQAAAEPFLLEAEEEE